MPGGHAARLIDGEGAVGALEEAGWDALLDRAGRRDPLRRSAVLRIPGPTAPSSPTGRALLIESGGMIVAGAALAVARERGLRTVRHMGSSQNWFDPEPPALGGEARRALARALVSQPGDILLLEEIAARSPLVAALRELRPDAELLPGPWSYRVAVTTSGSRMAARRREAGRLARRAAERGTPLRLTSTAQWSTISPQLDELLGLQSRAWEGRGGDVFTVSPGGRAFVRAAIAAAGAEDRARLTRIDVGGALAAFHLSLVWGTSAVVYKTAFDRGLHGLPGLGWASLLATVDLLSSEGVRSIDLGPWGGGYKSHIAEPVPMVTMRVALSPAGRAYQVVAGAKHRVTDAVRRRP